MAKMYIFQEHLKNLEAAKVDALIISDLGVFMTAKEVVPSMTLHVSTQASVVSARTCTEWYKLGAKRVILARELSLDEIKEIRANIPNELELEAFVHGSMCVSYSGRCLLSNYITGRDANRGACAQPCRWDYKIYHAEIEEVKRGGDRLVMIEEQGETFTFSSRDLCMIEHIPALAHSGLSCLKIEGRMKSACYVGAVVNTYRMALDSYFSDPTGYVYDEKWMRELESVCHREYCTGFFFGETMDTAKVCSQPGYIKEQAALGVCTGYDAEKGTVKYYKMKDGQMTYISEVEYNEWVANCPYDMSKNEDIEIIPLFDDEHPAPPPFVAPPAKG